MYEGAIGIDLGRLQQCAAGGNAADGKQVPLTLVSPIMRAPMSKSVRVASSSPLGYADHDCTFLRCRADIPYSQSPTSREASPHPRSSLSPTRNVSSANQPRTRLL